MADTNNTDKCKELINNCTRKQILKVFPEWLHTDDEGNKWIKVVCDEQILWIPMCVRAYKQTGKTVTKLTYWGGIFYGICEGTAFIYLSHH